MSQKLKTPKRTGSARSGRSGGSVVPAIPQVNLLPKEIAQGRSLKRLKRLLALVLMVVVVLIGGVVVATKLAHSQAQDDLAAEQARTQTLLAEQRKYMVVTLVTGRLGLTGDALDYVSQTDVRWAPLLDKVSGATPDEVRVSGIAIDSSSPVEVVSTGDVALDPENVATINIAGTADTRPDVTSWTRALEKIPGVAEARIETVAVPSADNDEYFEITVKVLLAPEAQRADGRIANLPAAKGEN